MIKAAKALAGSSFGGRCHARTSGTCYHKSEAGLAVLTAACGPGRGAFLPALRQNAASARSRDSCILCNMPCLLPRCASCNMSLVSGASVVAVPLSMSRSATAAAAAPAGSCSGCAGPRVLPRSSYTTGGAPCLTLGRLGKHESLQYNALGLLKMSKYTNRCNAQNAVMLEPTGPASMPVSIRCTDPATNVQAEADTLQEGPMQAHLTATPPISAQVQAS